MRPTTTLHIPQPCPESWAAMSPTGTGRHCAACAQTVVDFTLKTDAEILAYLARAGNSRTCGRFAAGQLERPLQRAASAAPTARWRAWLAAAVAVWGLREGFTFNAQAQAATEWCARYWGGPMPLAFGREAAATSATSVPSATGVAEEKKLIVRGIVRDSALHEGLPGVTVLLLRNNAIGVSTDVNGTFEFEVPAQYVTAGHTEISVSYVGYVSQQRLVIVGPSKVGSRFFLEPDVKGMLSGELVITGLPISHRLPPAPWHPRAFYYWGKYWLTRPFRRY